MLVELNVLIQLQILTSYSSDISIFMALTDKEVTCKCGALIITHPMSLYLSTFLCDITEAFKSALHTHTALFKCPHAKSLHTHSHWPTTDHRLNVLSSKSYKHTYTHKHTERWTICPHLWHWLKDTGRSTDYTTWTSDWATHTRSWPAACLTSADWQTPPAWFTKNSSLIFNPYSSPSCLLSLFLGITLSLSGSRDASNVRCLSSPDIILSFLWHYYDCQFTTLLCYAGLKTNMPFWLMQAGESVWRRDITNDNSNLSSMST